VWRSTADDEHGEVRARPDLGRRKPAAALRAAPEAAGPVCEEDDRMIPIAAGSSISTFAAVVLAGVLMVVASVSRKRLRWRDVECQVCHHPRALCTCRWL